MNHNNKLLGCILNLDLSHMFDNSRVLVAESIVMLLKKIVFIDIINSLSLFLKIIYLSEEMIWKLRIYVLIL